MVRLHSDIVKDKLVLWLEAKLLEAQKLGELPEVGKWSTEMCAPALGDETHVVALEMTDGNVFSLLVKFGDYTATKNE
jgi:hypothetical protein